MVEQFFKPNYIIIQTSRNVKLKLYYFHRDILMIFKNKVRI